MFEQLEVDHFHRSVLPGLVQERGTVAAEIRSDLAPLAFRLPDGRAWTYATADGIRVEEGETGAATVVALTEAAWSDFVTEAHTAFGLLYAGLLSFPLGSFGEFERWEPTLRALWSGRPSYDPVAIAHLDVHRSFRLNQLDAASAFLQLAGFVHLRGVFAADEIDGVRREVARLRVGARPDDGRSWWAKDGAGHDVCCRLLYATQGSATLAGFVADERLDRLAALAGTPLFPSPDRLDGVSVILKVPDAAEGLADLPWHRDCGLGGHPVLCPTVLIGVQLTAADAENGQLRFLAGSHLGTGSPPVRSEEEALPIVGIDADPGDVTVHFGHVLHVAPPPTSATGGRQTMYVSYNNPAVFDVVPPGKGYNDVLFTQLDDGHVRAPEEHLTAAR